MTAPHDAPTDPAIRARRTVGGMDVPTAGALEVGRGLLTSGGAALLLYQLLTTQLADMRDDMRQTSVEMRASVADVAEDVDRLSVELAALRGDVIRLQAERQQPAR